MSDTRCYLVETYRANILLPTYADVQKFIYQNDFNFMHDQVTLIDHVNVNLNTHELISYDKVKKIDAWKAYQNLIQRSDFDEQYPYPYNMIYLNDFKEPQNHHYSRPTSHRHMNHRYHDTPSHNRRYLDRFFDLNDFQDCDVTDCILHRNRRLKTRLVDDKYYRPNRYAHRSTGWKNQKKKRQYN